jgi:formylglycine-generating enzyme required for sulfatase activity
LPDQAAKVLLALLRAAGQMVSREELQQALWPGRVAGDFEAGLHAAVRRLRRALEDDGAEPRLVGTLPRHGYRMLVPVVAAGPAPVANPAAGTGTGRHPRRWRRLAWSLGAAAAMVAGSLFWPRPAARSTRILDLPNAVRLEMVQLPPGDFAMGLDTGFRASEPVHRVLLTHAFWIGRTEVTQAQWRAVMGSDPAYFQGDDKPVEQVSWEDCQAFLQRLNRLLPGQDFRLPTEAEWEYAARASSLGGSLEQPGEWAWNHANSSAQTHPVAQKRANPWGLYDMVGNVWEWVADDFGPYPPYPQRDPLHAGSGLKTLRGGSWLSPGSRAGVAHKGAARVTLRYGFPPYYEAKDLGLRLAAGPSPGAEAAAGR